MATLEQMAQAALDRDSLRLRSLTQDWLRADPHVSDTPRPNTKDVRLLAMSASLIELFAQRLHQAAPDWSSRVGAVEPFFLLKAAAHMKRLRVLCETQAPEPLRKRGFYAPPNWLEFA